MQEHVQEVIDIIESGGFEVYLVGGSVRDYLLDLEADDVDFATNATPDQIKQLFAFTKVIDTGIKHGTVTVLLHQIPMEITTYRTDSTYSDHRRPDAVHFSDSIIDDLARRDFTFNAMAFHPTKGLIDPYGGADDLVNGILRAVGNPTKRLEEDPLRILRGMRFIARFGLRVEAETDKALRRHADLLFYIAKERIFSELKAILLGPAVEDVLRNYPEVFTAIISELAPMIGFDSHNGHDLWMHTASVVAHAPKDVSLRLTALLHDIAKPLTEDIDEFGNRHYPDHQEIGDEMARKILRELRADNKTLFEVSQLIRYHDHDVRYQESAIRDWLAKLGPDIFRKLIDFQEADVLGQPTDAQEEKLRHLRKLRERIDIVLHGNVAFTLTSLEIDGHDLVKLGFPQGRTIGLILDRLLKEVMNEQLPNKKQALIDRAYQLK